MRKVKLVLFLISIVGLVATKVAAGQATVSKQSVTQQTAKGRNAQFTCPDSFAAEACKSFEELYRAGDEGVYVEAASVSKNTGYVCFRRGSDEFFVIWLTQPSFLKHLDGETHKLVPNDDATDSGLGHIYAFAHGIEDFSLQPSFYFLGIWSEPLAPTFEAMKIDGQEISDPDHFGFAVDPYQFSAARRYKNRAGKDIDYKLVIQRSTGRFSESFTEDSAKFPFLETNGRCSRLPLSQPKGK